MPSWSSVQHYFTRGAVAHVATLMPDGSPHSVPVWVGADGEHAVFFTIAGSKKDRNLQRDPRIAMSITHPENPLDMAFIRGRIVDRIDGDAALPLVDRIAHIYTGEPYPIRTGVAVFVIEPTTAWAADYTDD